MKRSGVETGVSSESDEEAESEKESDEAEESDSDEDSDSRSDQDEESDDDQDNSEDEPSIADHSQNKGDLKQQKNQQVVSRDPTIENRVFVCVGKYGKSKVNQQQAVWVMTLDKEFKTVNFWDCVQHMEVPLKGRIRFEEVEKLKVYLTDDELDAKEENLRKMIMDWRN